MRELPWSTVFRVIAALVFTYFVFKIINIALLIFLGLMIAVSLEPFVQRLKKAGLTRGMAIGTLAMIVFSAGAVIAFVLVPQIYAQATSLIVRIPELSSELTARFQGNTPFKSTAAQLIGSFKLPDVNMMLGYAVDGLRTATLGFAQALLALIFGFYLLSDGRGAYKWVADFFPAPVRLKLETTGREVSAILSAYVKAQVITSTLGFLAAFIILRSSSTPGATLISAMAGVMGLVPVVGFPITLFASTCAAAIGKSGNALFVASALILYHFVEVYLIVPRLYRQRMNVSALVVLLTLLIAGEMGGVLAIVTLLPIVASYPTIERIWLVDWLGPRVISSHAESGDQISVSEQVRVWGRDRSLVTGAHLAAREASDTHFGKILLVEDDADIRAMLAVILKHEGFALLQAQHGREGLGILESTPDVDIVILDRMMPVMDGEQLLAALSRNASLNQIPTLLLSADEKPVAAATLQLRKPIDLEALLKAIHVCMDLAQARKFSIHG